MAVKRLVIGMKRDLGFLKWTAIFLLFVAQAPIASLAKSFLGTQCGMTCCEKPLKKCCGASESKKIESVSACACEISSGSRVEFPTLLGVDKVKVVEIDSVDKPSSDTDVPLSGIENDAVNFDKDSGPPGAGFCTSVFGRAPPFAV